MSYEDWQSRKDGWTNSREGSLLDKTLEGHGAADRPRTPGHTDRVFGYDPQASRPMPRAAMPGGSTVPERTPIADDVPAGSPKPPRYTPF